MAPFTIETEDISEDGFLFSRRVTHGEHSLATPTSAISSSDRIGDIPTTQSESNVVELYRTISAKLLAKERKGDETPVDNRLGQLYDQVAPNELAICFLSYQDGKVPSEIETPQIVKLQPEYTDVLTTPLMPEYTGLIRVEDDIDGHHFENYLEFLGDYVDLCQSHQPEMPVMGVIPNLPPVHTRDVLDTYLERNVRMFCVNFDGAEVASQRSLGTLVPLAESIGRRDLERTVLTYGINASSTTSSSDAQGSPADEICAAALGLDVLGEYHVFKPLPEEAREDLKSGEEAGDPVTFTLFDKSSVTRRDIPLPDLAEEFPEDSDFNPHEIVEDVRQHESKLNTYENLVEAEQVSLLLDEVSSASTEEILVELTDRPGVPEKFVDAAQEVRAAFDRGKEQTGLGEFS